MGKPGKVKAKSAWSVCKKNKASFKRIDCERHLSHVLHVVHLLEYFLQNIRITKYKERTKNKMKFTWKNTSSFCKVFKKLTTNQFLYLNLFILILIKIYDLYIRSKFIILRNTPLFLFPLAI